MKKVLSLVLVFGLLLVGIGSATSAFAFLNGQNENCVLEGELALTEPQIEKLTEARNDFETKKDNIQEQIRNYNRSTDYKQADIEDLRVKLETARQEYMDQVEEILTEEQFSKIEQNPKINMYQGSQTKGNGQRQAQRNGQGNGNKKGNGRGQGEQRHGQNR
jgi:peptidoglycan hydrolase CwlO-like protein